MSTQSSRPPLGYNGGIMTEMMNWTLITYLQAGAYIAIMIAVFGGPQMLSSYFEARNRRADRLENESNAERRHREVMDAEARREERREERRLEERREERQREQEERRQEEERRQDERRQGEERRQDERRQEAELRRQESEAAERRHQELLTALIAAISNGRDRGDDQSRLVETLRQTVEALAIENARLRQRNGNGNPPPQATPGE